MPYWVRLKNRFDFQVFETPCLTIIMGAIGRFLYKHRAFIELLIAEETDQKSGHVVAKSG